MHRFAKLSALATLVAAVFCAPRIASAADLVIADGGRSDYTIVIASEASDSEKHGATELQMFLEQISGATLPIATDVETVNGPMILVGRSKKLAELELKIDFEPLGDEGFAVQTAPPHLVLAGGRKRGSMFAVYTFLEDHLDCRWWTDTASRIPKRERIEIGSLQERHAPPAIRYRWVAGEPDWSTRNKLNAYFIRADGDYYAGGHTFHRFLPPKQHFEEHPEYYSLISGERRAVQICLTNPDVVRIVTENVKQHLREEPGIDILGVGQMDGFGGACECPDCKALDDQEDTHSATVINFVNQVADGIAEEFPDVFIGTLAYLYTKQPPKTIRPRPNVVVRMGTIQKCLSHSSATCDFVHTNTFRENIAGWRKLTDRIQIWDYVISFHNYLLPFPNLESIGPTAKFFVENSVDGVLWQDREVGEVKDLRRYMLAKIAWNPDVDARAVRDEFLEGFYGPAGGPIGEYLDMIHKKVRDDNIHMFIWAKAQDGWLTPEILSRARELFDAAERLVEGQPELVERVEMVRLAIQYAELSQPSPYVDSAPIYERFKAVVEREKIEHYGETGKYMKAWLADKGAMCALAKFDAGDHAGGIYGLESALSISPENLGVARQVEQYRRKVLPDLLTYASVDVHLDAEVLLPEGAVWRYFPGKEAPSPGVEWAQGEFDDQSWREGKSGFGYGDDDDATVLEDMRNEYTSVYIRRSFDVRDPSAYEKMVLSVSVDDGFIAYLNGVEVGRSNVPDASPGADGTANVSAREPLVPISVELSPRKGRNVLALHGLNRALESSDFSLAPAVAAVSKPNPQRYRPLFEKYLESVPEPVKSIAAYFEGQVLASEGKHADAAEKFRVARELDRSRREPVDRLLESLRASGQTEEAERIFNEAEQAVEGEED